MKVKAVFPITVLMLFLTTAVGCSILQEPQAASEPIEAIPLDLEATAEPPTEVRPTEAPPTEVPPTEEPASEMPAETKEPQPTEEPTAEPTSEPVVEETTGVGDGLLIYQIVPGESAVRFELDEDLRGLRNTVVGTTDQVAGEIGVDFNDLSTTQIGALQINARTLATDNEFRNRAIKNDILDTNSYEFITFTPTAVEGLPDSVEIGETVAFTITGDLTIRDITQAATFDVEATAVSANELQGTASSTVQRADYDLNIPSVPNVANVEEEVALYIDFIARSSGEAAFEMPAQAEAGDTSTMLMLAENDQLGAFLTDSAGMTLYTFANDEPGISNCYDRCATAWPPLLVEEGETVSAESAVSGELGTTERDDGTVQVTYDGWPLYYWVNDEAPGDTTGQNVRNVWAVAWPTTKVLLGGNEELGRFLTGINGMTLYRFIADEPGASSCNDQCAANWPPLLLEEGEDLTGGAGVVGELGTAERDDGTVQVTYNGMPLYFWANDENPGDATGQSFNDVWFVVSPYTLTTGSSEELGDFLVGGDSMTLYQFANDEEDLSNCYDQCADNWPPLLVQPGEAPIAGFGVTGDLGVIGRDDETLQVTYNGIPLYYWVKDETPGDTTGQGVNDVWFVVAP
ncbi:MAG: YceI family protein [Candidatus Promineifilaceae bacterium]|jgi:predicted lipoprotein with Yx(FWY)xxD motif/polyisoprenoid-binding protein YceI